MAGAATDFVVNILGNATSAVRAMGETEHAAGELVEKSHNVGSLVAGVFGGGLALEGAEKLKDFATESIDKLSELAGETRTLQRSYGGTAEQTSALIAVSDRFGVSSQSLGTAFGRAAKGIDTNKSILDQWGISTHDAQGQALSMSQLLPQIIDHFAKLGPGTTAAAQAQELFGRGGLALLPVLQAGNEKYDEYAESAKKAGTVIGGDALASTFKYQQAQKELNESVEGAQIQIGEKLYPTLITLTNWVTSNVVPAITGLFGWLNQNRVLIGNLAIVVGVLVGAFALWNAAMTIGNTVTSIGTAIKGAWAIATGAQAAATEGATVAQTGLNVALDANPIGLIVLAIAALVAGLIWFFTQTTIGKQIWSGFIGYLTSAWRTAVEVGTIVWQALGTFFTNLWNGIVNFVTGVVSGFTNWLIGTARLFVAAWNLEWQLIRTFFTTLWNGIVSWVTGVVSTFVEGLRLTARLFVAAWNLEWELIRTFFTGLWNGVTSFVRGAVSDLTGWLVGSARGVVSTWNSTWNGIVSFFRNLWDDITSAARSGVGTVRGIVDDVVGFVSGLRGRITSAAAGMWNGITSGFRSAINTVIDDWNGLHFSIPSIKIGSFTFGGGNFGLPQIPHLATGGVTNGPTYALIGDNPGGREVVQPLTSLQQELARERASATAAASRGSQQKRGTASALHIENYYENGNSADEVAAAFEWRARAWAF